MKILIVEESRANRLVLSQYVERSGATALAVENGETAIDTFIRQRPDLILLDVALSDIDGFTLAQRIRGLENPNEWTPIIFLSSLGQDKDLEKGIAAGGDDCLDKPVSETVLRAKIRAMQRFIQMRTSLVVLARKLDSANQELKQLSASDGLTGIANRRVFDDHISHEWRRARRNTSSLALLMCDVDYFKLFNDTYGHQAGDNCLRQVAGAIEKYLERPSDIVARYGGEEFAVILPETELGGTFFVAEKIRRAIHALNIPHANSAYGRITMSIGVAAAIPDRFNPFNDLIQSADRALYRAKEQGRDQVCSLDIS